MESVGTEKKESPIENAMSRLKNAIGSVKETMTGFESTLSTVLTHPEKPTDVNVPTTEAETSLESQLNDMRDEIMGINRYLRELQNRIQL